MKRILLSLLLGIGSTPFTFAQIVTIPDVNFKAYLVANTNINTNADTEIQVAEAIAFNGEINCNSQGILDLTGLEAFVNLKQLSLWYEPFATIDLSQNVNLIDLVCFDNNLTTLDVSNCILLKTLRCERNDITTIDVSMLPALEWLLLTDCALTCNRHFVESKFKHARREPHDSAFQLYPVSLGCLEQSKPNVFELFVQCDYFLRCFRTYKLG